MIGFRSRTWWEMFSCAGVLAFAACSGVGTQQEPVDTDEPGSVSGELAVYMADYEDGRSETSYFLRDVAGNERRLLFQQEPDVAPGAKIKVWGTEGAEAIDVRTFKPVASLESAAGIGSQSSALIGQSARPSRVLCTVLVQNGAATPSITLPAIDAAWHTGPKSDNNYMFENSYGRDAFAGGTHGPFTFDMAGGCNTSGLATALRPMVTAEDATCQHFAWVISPNAAGCAWAGLGAVGTSDKPQKDTWYNNTTGCVAAVQEVMHNWGSLHSSSIANCTGATPATGGINDTLAGCVHSEYGDKFDTMGGGCRHLNAWQKLYQKVWGGCNAVRVTSSGTFNLYPTEVPCNGVQALQIPFPGGKTRAWQGSTLTSWYLEYRISTGSFDTGLVPQVLVHLGIAPVLANQANPRGSRVWITNLNTTAQPGLTAGKSFSDPAGGLTVTVDSMDTTKAVITVDYPGGTGSPVCLDGLNTAFAPPGPADCTLIPQPPDGGGIVGVGGATGAGGVKVDAGRSGAGGGVGVGGAGGAATGGQGGIGQAGSGEAGTTGQAGTGQPGTGVAGAGPTGSGGNDGSGTTTAHADPGDVTGGCACRMQATTQRSPSLGGLLALGLGGFFVSRRRSRRRVG